MPKRIQRQRTKGWKAPEGAVYVGRPTKWGNPFSVAINGRSLAMRLFRDIRDVRGYPTDETVKHELRGKDLMCWCPVECECHADVLLEIANREIA